MKIFDKKQIEQSLDLPATIQAIEEGFVIYSKKEAVIPPVATLHFSDPPGDCHIKYGYAKRGKYYVIKIASGFYDNPRMGIPANNGLMLLFDKNTGTPEGIILDEGYLTDMRTAVAGCIAAKYLAPKKISCIGIVGTGAQAHYQLKLLPFATSCKKAMVWGRDASKAQKFSENSELKKHFHIEVAKELDQLTRSCNLIVTTTSSSKALLFAKQIKAGTHITAMGADDKGKQELDPNIFAKADLIVVDSRSQCAEFGDASYALKQGVINIEQMIELGEVIQNPSLRRKSDAQITVADLTGVAIQDLQIASLTFDRLSKNRFFK